jgi:cytochrome c-type biogenesis protein CcmH
MFWFYAALLIVAAVAWLFIRLNQKDQTPIHSASTSNLVIYRERLNELKRDLQNGTLLQNEFTEAKEELAASLLNDLNSQQTTTHAARKSALVWLLGGCLVILPMIAFPLHSFLQAQLFFQEIPPGSSLELQKYFMNSDQNGLSMTLANDTRDSRFWEKSAQVYLQSQRPDAAVQAFQRAIALSGDTAVSLLGQAHATAMLQRGSLDGAPAELILRALAAEPNNPQVHVWSGLLSLQHGEYDVAINYFERALQSYPTDNPQRASVLAMIEQTKQQKTGKPAATTDAPASKTTTATATNIQVRIRVEISPALAAQARPEDTVFILARAVNGPRMPLAIVSKQVKDLPATITLDDSTAMSSETRISAFNQVKVTARITRSGQATPQPGDLFGDSSPIDPTSHKTTKLVINQQVQ